MNISQKNLAKLLEYMATHIRYKERYDRELCSPLEDMNREKIDSNLIRYLTVKVKKFDLETEYFSKKEEDKKGYRR